MYIFMLQTDVKMLIATIKGKYHGKDTTGQKKRKTKEKQGWCSPKPLGESLSGFSARQKL